VLRWFELCLQINSKEYKNCRECVRGLGYDRRLPSLDPGLIPGGRKFVEFQIDRLDNVCT
jgi:hypothetical protein